MIRRRHVLPGFRFSLGYALLYLTLIVFIPLVAGIIRATSLSWAEFISIVTHPQVVASYKLGFSAALIATAFNGLIGLVVAWTLVRYDFPGRRIFDALVDFPLALPTAVAGITYASLYAPSGWIGQYMVFMEADGWLGHWFSPDGWFGQTFFSMDIRPYDGPLAIVIVLVFVSLPFVIRSVQPVLTDLDREVEEAAASLGATRWQTFRHVILPSVLPAWLTGLALTFARAVGEYGSVVFVSSNLPFETEIPPVIIVAKLEQFKYDEAAAIAVVLLMFSFSILLVINLLERWSKKRERAS